MKKKLLIILFAIVAAFACAFGVAGCSGNSGSKPETVTQDGITYELHKSDSYYDNESYYIVSSADKNLTEAVILSECEGLTVKRISGRAFTDCKSLTDVTIPDSVSAIDSYVSDHNTGAFSGCTALKNISLGNGVKSIGYSAFRNCSSLESITLPDNLGLIAPWAFVGCSSLESITLPENIHNLGDGIFTDCTSLKVINYNVIRCSGCIPLAYNSQPENEITLNIGSKVQSIPLQFGGFNDGYAPKIVAVNFAVNGQLSEIWNKAFAGCESLTSITIPDSVIRILNNAFSGSGLESVTIGGGITEICDGVFSDCSKLRSVKIGDNVTKINKNAFSGCGSLTNITIPASVKTIDETAFENSQVINVTASLNSVPYISTIPMKSLTITDGTSIPANYFDKFVGLEKLTLPSTITSVGASAFAKCKSLWAVNIPDLTAWCKIQFANEEANPLYIAHNLYLNGEYVYKLTVPETVKEISDYAFDFCTSIVSVTLPEGLEAVGESSFKNCHKLIEVYNLSTLNIEKGSENNGFVGQNALRVYTDGSAESELTYTDGGYIYYGVIDGNSYADITYVGLWKEVEDVSLHALILDLFIHWITVRDYAFYNCGFIKNVFINATHGMDETVFYGCNNIETVDVRCGDFQYIPKNNIKNLTLRADSYETINDLEAEAFKNNKKLESVELNFYGTIGESAFKGCTSLKKVIINDGINEIGDSAFFGCTGLTGISIGNGVTSIGDNAFRGCSSLNSINMPNSITHIGYNVFYDCSSLVYNTYGNANYLGNEENLYLVLYKAINKDIKNCTIHEDTKVLCNGAFSYCMSLSEINFNASDCADLNSGNGVFSYAGKSGDGITVNIGVNVTKIPEYVFNPSNIGGTPNIVTIKFEENSKCECIASYAFYNCTSLKSIIIPNGLNSIGDYAFSGCSSLTSVNLPNSLMSIGEHVFKRCATKIVWDDNPIITVISAYAFSGYEGSSITVPKSVNAIEDYAYENCQYLTEINFNASDCADLNSGNGVFSYAGKSGDGITVNIGVNVTKIPAYLFCSDAFNSSGAKYYSPNLLTVNFNEGGNCKTIGDHVFAHCITLRTLSIPNSVTSIGSSAFYNCTSLESVSISENITSIDDNLFYGCASLAIVTIPNGVTSIGKQAFFECVALTRIVIPDSVTYIGYCSFYNCNSLESATIGRGVTIIDHGVFWNCTDLAEVNYLATACTDTIKGTGSFNARFYNAGRNGDGITLNIGANVTRIPKDMFKYYDSNHSPNIKLINFDEFSVLDTIGDYAFSNTSIGDIALPNCVSRIGIGAFSNCTSITNITIPNNLINMGGSAFSNCSSLETVYWNAFNCSYAGNDYYACFHNCTKLVNLVIGEKVKTVPSYAFNECTALRNVFYHGTTDEWSKIDIGSNNKYLTNATMYYYSETEPAISSDGTTYAGNYWQYDVDGVTPVVWIKEN